MTKRLEVDGQEVMPLGLFSGGGAGCWLHGASCAVMIAAGTALTAVLDIPRRSGAFMSVPIAR